MRRKKLLALLKKVKQQLAKVKKVKITPVKSGKWKMATITDDQFLEWLADTKNTSPTVLVVAQYYNGASVQTAYFGDRGYTSYTTDNPSSQYFESILAESINITESMHRTSVGAITVFDDGTHSDWLGFQWKGYPVKVYLGDARWKFSNFRLMISGVNNGISAPRYDRYRFMLRDPAVVLDELIAEDLKPICVGSPLNVPAVLINAAALRYKVHDGEINGYTIRDSGVQLAQGSNFTIDRSVAEFELVSPPAGKITADVTKTGSTVKTSVFELVEYMDTTNNDQLFDSSLGDAILKDPYNSSSIAMYAYNNGVLSTSIVDGDNILEVRDAATPENENGGETLLNSYSSTGLTTGDTYKITGQVRYDSAGGAASWNLALKNNAGDTTVNLESLGAADTDWVSFSGIFTYGTGTNDSYKIRANSQSGIVHTGGLDIRNVQVHKTSLQIDSSVHDLSINGAIGIFAKDSQSVKSLLDKIMQCFGGYYRFNTSGQLVVKQLLVPSTPDFTLAQDDILQNGITHLGTDDPIGEMILRYNRNWEVQSADGLAGSVTIDDRDTYSRPWKEVSKTNTLTGYPLLNNAAVDSYIVDNEIPTSATVAQAEVDRRQVIRSTKRERFKVKTTLAAVQVNLGDTVNITYPQYGFVSGKNMRVIGIKRSLGKQIVELMIWG